MNQEPNFENEPVQPAGVTVSPAKEKHTSFRLLFAGALLACAFILCVLNDAVNFNDLVAGLSGEIEIYGIANFVARIVWVFPPLILAVCAFAFRDRASYRILGGVSLFVAAFAELTNLIGELSYYNYYYDYYLPYKDLGYDVDSTLRSISTSRLCSLLTCGLTVVIVVIIGIMILLNNKRTRTVATSLSYMALGKVLFDMVIGFGQYTTAAADTQQSYFNSFIWIAKSVIFFAAVIMMISEYDDEPELRIPEEDGEDETEIDVINLPAEETAEETVPAEEAASEENNVKSEE